MDKPEKNYSCIKKNLINLKNVIHKMKVYE